jgi:hypothetical protein
LLAASLLVWLVVRAWGPAPTLADALVVAAVVVYWPFQEWFLHAYVLHFRPRRILGIRIDPAPARIHRWHHRHPWVVEGVFLPVRTLVLLTVSNAAAWLWLLPRGPAVTGIAMLTAAALLYEWVHFIAHAPYIPRTAYVRGIRRHHQLHHFKNEHYWHAFTVPAIDRLFGTGPDADAVSRSDTVRTLGVDDPC